MGAYDHIKVKAQRIALFETPIVHAHIDDGDALAKELEAIVRKRMAQDESGVQRSNVGGWHSDVQMLKWGGEPAQILLEKAIAIAKRMSNFGDKSVDDFRWAGQMWANVSGPGASNHMHVHPGNLWSGAFYVNLGRDSEEEADIQNADGAFYFEDPRFPLPVMHNTRFRFLDSNGAPMAWQPEVFPQRSDIIMFPAWLKHGVRPYKGGKDRISVAFNVDALSK